MPLAVIACVTLCQSSNVFCCLRAVRTELQAAERNAQELLATEAKSKSHHEGGQKKGKKKKKVSDQRYLFSKERIQPFNQTTLSPPLPPLLHAV